MASDFIETISRAFTERGADAYGENVSQLDHALQCALLAQNEGAICVVSEEREGIFSIEIDHVVRARMGCD